MRIANLDRLKRKLRHMPTVAREEVRAAFEASANELVDVMKRMVPVGEGALQRSIGWTWGAPPEGATVFTQAAGEAGLVITIYAGDRTTIVTNERGIAFQNALLQEYGTERMTANPFFRPAWRLGGKRARGRVTRSLGRAARKIAAGG